jgi:hypothetical protein
MAIKIERARRGKIETRHKGQDQSHDKPDHKSVFDQ